MLTANYMPEYGRASGGQIRFISKSGSSRYSGNASYLLSETRRCRPTPGRATAARTRRRIPARRRSTRSSTATRSAARSRAGCSRTSCSSSARRSGLTTSQVPTNTATVPTLAMRRGDFSELLGSNPFFSTAQIIRDPLTGQPFPGNIIPTGRLSPNGTGFMKLYPAADAGLPAGHGQCDFQQREPAGSAEGQHPARLPAEQQQPVHLPLSRSNWVAIDAFRGTFPSGAHRMGAAESDGDLQLDQHHQQQPDQRLQLLALARRRVHRRVHRERPAQAQPRRHQLPVHLPGRQGDRGQDPDGQRAELQRLRRRSVSIVLGGADSHVLEHHHLVRGRHTFKAGVVVEYSGEDDFDQINVNSIPGGTNNQNGQFAFSNSGSGPLRSRPWPTWRLVSSSPTRSSGSAPSRSGARSRPTSSFRTRGGHGRT